MDGPKKKPPKRIQSWQAYSRLYFEERIKPILDTKWEAKQKELDDGTISVMPHKLAFLQETTSAILATESEEVKAEVEAYRNSPAGQEGTKAQAESEDDHETLRIAKASELLE